MSVIRQLLPTLYQLTGIVLTLAGIFAAVVAYAMVDRALPRADIMTHPAKTEFRQDTEFAGMRHLTVRRECPGTSIRWVTKLDDPLWVMQLPDASPDYGNVGSGPLPRRVSIAVAPFHIPPDMPPGRYAYHIKTHFYCNRAQYWLRWPITIASPVIEFTVTPDYAHDPRRGPLPRRGR